MQQALVPLAERELTDVQFAAFAAMLRENAGIVLGASKREMVLGRLSRRLRALGLCDFGQYLALLDRPEGEAERTEMVNALTTNLTSFFREAHHFKCLAEDVLPVLAAEAGKAGAPRRLRIWSAACSSGEEPYSIAMILRTALSHRGTLANAAWDARILATDIDTNMVKTAQEGCYDAERAGTIPATFAHFATRQGDGMVAMAETLKQLVTFNPLNLLADWPMRRKFDVIFCRNVVIYFDKPAQRTLFERFADIMTPGGWLFIGHSESLLGVSDRFDNLGRTIYRKRQ